ncbi:hypothetical protein ABDK56_10460 [Sphingomonas sp. ASV193]|uniref:hypothetical protein n=1 Tax=Sphingomonas sp. ASV193 TaxID=3144405 RepID=UPI0032E90DDB
MTGPIDSWDTLVRFALTLPGTELSTYYGGPAIKVAANGRAFLSQGREADSFVLAIDQDSKRLLFETDPATFWQTPHYEGWDGLLVRYASADPERVKATIRRAHDLAAAKKPVAARRRK